MNAGSLLQELELLPLQPFSFAFTTPDTLHPIPCLAKLWLTRLRTAVNVGTAVLKALTVNDISIGTKRAD
jgi:hypothetical protein